MGYANIQIRPYAVGEELILREVFYSAVHQIDKQYYSLEQIEAWAPFDYDKQKWISRLSIIKPFVVVIDGDIVAYADLQQSGYIDHFFVKASHTGKGVGSTLMHYLHNVARSKSIVKLFADVSLAAEHFFTSHGFIVEERKIVTIGDVELKNARMSKIVKITN